MTREQLALLLTHAHLTLKAIEGAAGPDAAALLRAQVVGHHLATMQAPDPVRKALAAVAPRLRATPTARYDVIRKAIAGLEADAAKRDVTARRIADALVAAAAAAEEQPIAANPALAPLVEKARLYQLAALAGGDDAWVEVAAKGGAAVAGLDSAGIGRLIKAGTLDEARGRAVGLAAAVFELSDRQPALAAAVLGARPASLGGKNPTTTLDLARVTPREWAKALSDAQATLPPGSSLVALGPALAARFGEMHPGAALVSRLPRPDATKVIGGLAAVSPLLARNPRLFATDFGQLDTADLDAAVRARIAAIHAELRGLDRAYPGLALAEVLDDSTLPASEKAATLVRRVGLVRAIQAQVGEDRALELDYGPRSADLGKLGWAATGATPAEQTQVLRTLKAHQRVHALTSNADDARALLAAGLHSARQIATLDFQTFSARAGLPEAAARRTYARAGDLLGDASNTFGAIVAAWGDRLTPLGTDNVQPDALAYLRKLDGFDALFGSLAFCNCEACQSILGPAAYFVDLMAYVDDKIRPQFLRSRTGTPPDTTLDLKTRRPDLWTLPLTCANTSTLIATLEIVDEVLETYIATAKTTGQRSEVYGLLAEAAGSFHQPFHLPIVRADAYLDHLGSSRAEVADALGSAERIWAAAALGVGKEEWTLIVKGDPTPDRLTALYGVAVLPETIDVQTLLPRMGLSRAELGALVQTEAVHASGASVTIKAEKRLQMDVQNNVENVHGLTPAALDLLHRLTRLRRRLPWTFEQLDGALTALSAQNLSEAHVCQVARVLELQRALGLSLDETCALVGPVPGPLFDRLWNPTGTAVGARWPLDTAMFVHPALRDATTPADAASRASLSRLALGLGLDPTELEGLIRALAVHLQAGIEGGFLLTAGNLGLLYRHARLARALGISIAGLVQRLDLADVEVPVDSLAKVRALLAWSAWQKSSGYRSDDVAVAIGRPPMDSGRFPDPAAIAAEVVAGLPEALSFAPTVFAVVLGMTDQGSRDLAAALCPPIPPEPAPAPPVLVPVGDRLRLADGVDLATAVLTIPETARVPDGAGGSRQAMPEEVRGVLAGYACSAVVARRLGAALRIAPGKVAALARFAGLALDTTDAASVAELVGSLRPFLVAFQAEPWDADAIDHVAAHPAAYGVTVHPAPDGVAVPPTLTAASLRALATFARLATRQPKDRPAWLGDLGVVIEAYTAPPAAPPGFPEAVDEALARVLGVSRSAVSALRGALKADPDALTALARLDRIAGLAARTGLDGQALAALISDDFATLEGAADATQAAVRARYPDATEREKQLDLLDQPLRERRRDALADYVVRAIRPDGVDEVADLSPYFLLDVEAGGCQTTSRVIAATNSVQLYIQRVILHLEQDGRPGEDHVEIRLPAEAVAEWGWRKNYRVWEANRKVFLWPENYLEPDLRDDKTPLFKELEADLLQTEISEQNVLDAYGKYLKGFEELASLTIAGAYQDIGSHHDVLHLFGVTNSDPPIFYYRTCAGLQASGRDSAQTAMWTPWKKVEVQITARRVAPVVYDGRLHVFWMDIKTRPISSFKGGDSVFDGYNHTMRMRFTTLQLDGSWTVPQEIEMPVTGPPVYWEYSRTTPEQEKWEYKYVGSTGSYDSGYRWVDTTIPESTETLPAETPAFGPTRGMIQDRKLPRDHSIPEADVPKHLAAIGPRLAREPLPEGHAEPIEAYTLSGPNWDWCWPELRANELYIHYRNFVAQGRVDLYAQTLNTAEWTAPGPHPQILVARQHPTDARLDILYSGVPEEWTGGRNAFPNLVIEECRLEMFDRERQGDSQKSREDTDFEREVAHIWKGTQLLAIPGNVEDVIAQVGHDVILLQGTATADAPYVARRIGTTLAQKVAKQLFTTGIDGLLSIDTQRQLKESFLPMIPQSGIVDRSNKGRLDFGGPYGTYYREIFLHIPFLIANHLNSQGRYADAQRWYHHLFDPTSTEPIAIPTGASADERTRRLRDRVWQYLEFRKRDAESLRATLTNPEALVQYRSDPFNPHAIARLRVSAYPKAVVMKYIDNLTDWADQLFTQFTRESLNEAGLLYQMAGDLLGPRPPEIGRCGEGGVKRRDYAHISAAVDGADDLLVEVESWITGGQFAATRSAPPAGVVPGRAPGVDRPLLTRAIHRRALPSLGAPMVAVAADAAPSEAPFNAAWRDAGPTHWTPALSAGRTLGSTVTGGRQTPSTRMSGVAVSPGFRDEGRRRFAWGVVRQVTPVFCIPPNRELLAYWDRVADRLFKLRHCLDIDGVWRELPLLSPEIDPHILVSARAAGIALDELFATGSGDLPPYRFLFLIEKAKAFAGSLQSFGGALLSALEKRDAEEMSRLRTVHEKNLATMTTRLREWEVSAAEDELESSRRRRESTECQLEFQQGLLDEGNNNWEQAERIARHSASAIRTAEAILMQLGAKFSWLPQAGSPFAITYGGIQISSGTARSAGATGMAAAILDATASSASLEASYARRAEGWRNQRDLAAKELRVLDKQVTIAELRLKMAQRSLEIHQKSLEQTDEVLDLMDRKFTSQGLYTWLSQQLLRLHRDAYTNALSLAKLAEQAWRFERNDDSSPGLAPSYWEPGRAGLLAGDRLLLDLQQLERRFIETNYRTHEIDQSFSVSQIAPAALLALKETGSCEVEISEFYFDLCYPGHYRRRIRAVRLTLPCVTGPYVNVGATLELLGSQVRSKPDQALVDVPLRRTTSIATSNAQNDGGVFELNFHDERYMPFEGAGAVSRWRITLPKSFRPFDYRTLADVILSIAYNAEMDDGLRAAVDQESARLESLLTTTPLARVFSLRQDFSSAFARLMRSPLDTEARLDLDDRHFPVFAQGKNLIPTRALALVLTAAGVVLGDFAIAIDGDALQTVAWTPQTADLPNLPDAPLPVAFKSKVRPQTHTLQIKRAGGLAPDQPPSNEAPALDPEKLFDLLLYVEYTLEAR